MNKIKLYATLLLFSVFLSACSVEDIEETPVTVVDDVSKYSRISSTELIDMVGKPLSVDQLNTGKADVETYSYNINNNHYEFILSDDAVVRTTIYSDKYWNNGTEVFTYSHENDMPKMFGIEITDTTKGGKNGMTFELCPVNDKIAYVKFGNVSNGVFEYIKVTYDVRPF